MTEASQPLLTVTVLQGETVVCAVDSGGRVLAPPSAADRAIIVSALGQAIAAVATLPPDEPPGPPMEATVAVQADHLREIGTDQAVAVMDLLAERLGAVAEAMRLANSLIAANAIAAGERAMGAVEH